MNSKIENEKNLKITFKTKLNLELEKYNQLKKAIKIKDNKINTLKSLNPKSEVFKSPKKSIKKNLKRDLSKLMIIDSDDEREDSDED